MLLQREAVGPVEAVYPKALLARLVEEQVQCLVRSLGIAPYLLEVRCELLGQTLLRTVPNKLASQFGVLYGAMAARCAWRKGVLWRLK